MNQAISTFADKARTITLALVGVLVLAGVSFGFTARSEAAASPELIDRALIAGINYQSTPSWDVCVGDFNSDGNDDFLASLHMKNAGALFTGTNTGSYTQLPTNTVAPRPTPGYGTKAWVDRHACAWADVDHNGLQDVYASAGRWATNKFKDEGINNELWLQTSPGSWQDVATAAGVGEPCGRGRHIVFADFNNDGWDDMFLGAQKERADSADICNRRADYPYIEQSKVFINRGTDAETGAWLGFRFGPEFNVSGDSTGNRVSIAWDENRDGMKDLIALVLPNKKPFFYRNTGTGFTEMSRSGLKRFPNMSAAKVGDVNRDGIDDLLYSDASGFYYLRGTATGLNTTVNRIGALLPSNADGWNIALGDINGDGLVDIYGQTSGATTGNPDDYIFLAQSSGGWRTLTVPSAGGDANDVEAVSYTDESGVKHTQFVVVNGGNDEAETPGPIQLIAWNL